MPNSPVGPEVPVSPPAEVRKDAVPAIDISKWTVVGFEARGDKVLQKRHTRDALARLLEDLKIQEK